MTWGNMSYVWLVAFIIFLILEGVTAQLVSIWFVVGSLAALLVTVLGGPIWMQILAFLLVSATVLVFTRPLVRKLTQGRVEPTNADRVIGSQCLVTEAINNLEATGTVSVRGKTWTARSADGQMIPVGALVTITNIEGVKVIVLPIQ